MTAIVAVILFVIAGLIGVGAISSSTVTAVGLIGFGLALLTVHLLFPWPASWRRF